MVEFKRYPGIDAEGKPVLVTVASGPVIVRDGFVLLDKHGDDPFWKFPGGRTRDNESLQATAMREAAEEVGLTDLVLHDKPVVLSFERGRDGMRELVTLYHYWATTKQEPKKQRDVRELAWHKIDALPADCAPNIKPVMAAFQRMGK